MIGMRRPLLPAALLAAALASNLSAQAGDAFREGVELLNSGQRVEALAAFKRVLAENPTHEEAYELWASTDQAIWLDMLSMGGEFEKVAKELSTLSSLGRKERSSDEEAIRAALAEMWGAEDTAARNRAVYKISAEHGEYAVPQMIYALADDADADRRIATMAALGRMNTDVVLPLVEALESPDAFLRRNVAFTLGNIGDPRASAALASHAADDPDETVRQAAASGLERNGWTSGALEKYLALGNAYYNEDDSVLRPHQVSDVIWRWEGNGLASTPIPRFLYGLELAKRAYYDALDVAPGSNQALAGIARCAVAQRGRLEAWEAAGQDAGDWGQALDADMLAVQLAGSDALDAALAEALEARDDLAASGLCRALAQSATSSSPALQNALTANKSGAVRGEAAVALGRIAARTGTSVDAETVAALSEAAARKVLQIVVLIDGDDARRQAMANTLEGRGLFVNAWPSATRGLPALRAVPGVDAVVVSDALPDFTVSTVVGQIREDPRLSEVPVLVLSGDAEADESLFGDATGVLYGSDDLSVLDEALASRTNRERDQANRLAVEAAGTLAMLARNNAGTLAPAASSLAGALADRPSEVVGPCLEALASIGNADEVAPVAAVLENAELEEDVRIAAANALGGIFGRTGTAATEVVDGLRALAGSEGSLALRTAVASALGRLNLGDEVRAELIRGLRGE